MHPKFLTFISCATALRISSVGDENKLKVTTLQDILTAESMLADMVPAKHKNYNVSIMTFKHFDIISNKLQNSGQWDGDNVNSICNKFKKFGGKGNILDVGGNIGSYSIPLAACLKENGHANNKLITIEGAPWNAQLLRVSMKYNSLDNMHLYEYAVGSPSEPKYVQFVKYNANAGKSRVGKGTEKGATQVEMTTIDSIASAEGKPMRQIFAMKMDIEGHELPALQGATSFLENGPCTIFIECQDFYWGRVKHLLENNNYVVLPGGKQGATEFEKNYWLERRDFDTCVKNLQ